MPARLKSFELHGYKTFATRNEFIFSDGITAIVGPNGSGKSNIADALRWVLGEQSFGLLRAKKTEDMIFSGSENRPRSGMASATIVFDNSDGWLPIDFAEVGITRRAYRDGENEYLLNGQRVRLRDVSEILSKSGLAERTYTIIGQGLVDAALALRAEERRRLFEEAAGIGLHRLRREEALKRLENTHRNLERVHDILAELQPRLRSLERQAKRAQEYDQKKAELKLVLRDWYGYHWHKSQAELVESQKSAKIEEDALVIIQSAQRDLDQKLSEYRIKINELREELNQWHKELTTLHQRREIISRDQAVNGERSRSLLVQIEQQAQERTRIEEEIGIQKEHLQMLTQQLTQLEGDLEEAHNYEKESLQKLNLRQEERSIVEQRISEGQQNLNRVSTNVVQQQALLTEKEASIRRLQEMLNKLDQEIALTEDNLSSAENVFKVILQEKEEKSRAIEEIKTALVNVQDNGKSLEKERNSISESASVQKTKIAKLEAQLNVLEEAEKSLTGYDEGAKILIQGMNKKQIHGAIDSLSKSLLVPEEIEIAIAAVLGESIEGLIIESIEHSDQALDLIKDESIRATLFPLDVISPEKKLNLDLEKAPVTPGDVIGIAAELIKTEPKLKPIVDLLFGHIIIVRNRKAARSILSSRNWRDMPDIRFVTLKGELYSSKGPITIGASGRGVLARPRQQREIRGIIDVEAASLNRIQNKYQVIVDQISSLQKREKELSETQRVALIEEKNVALKVNKQEMQLEKIKQDIQLRNDQKKRYVDDIQNETAGLSSLKFAINGLQEKIIEINRQLATYKNNLGELPLDEFQAEHAYWKTNAAVIAQALSDIKNRQKEKSTQIEQSGDNLLSIVNRLSQMEQDISEINERIKSSSLEEGNVSKGLEDLTKIVEPKEALLASLEKEHSDLLSSDSESRRQLRTAEQKYTQAKITLAHHQESFDSLCRHIEDDFGLVAFDYTESVSGPKPLPLNGLVEELPKVEVLPDGLEETIRQQKAQIRRMGAINPEAQLEYQEVKERFEFLSSQVEDLSKAEEDIKLVIIELDNLMEREFRKTFDAVAQEFKQIFTRLFGGGSARLALTDPGNISETGIDIEARLPGRREQGLSLLSGGERSLTAAALVFSLLRVSPTPFCILDEVDAMLDEANVGRFRDLLTELSNKTQFIVITHNRNTVQAASIIYGITMGRDSASQVISLKIDELGDEFGV